MKETDKLIPLKDKANQAFYSKGLQIYQIIQWVVEQTGPVDLVNTTFSVAEEFLRAIFRLKQNGLIISATEIADLKSAAKTQKINNLLRGVFDKVYLAENHSKVVLMVNDTWTVSIITSQNQTRGNRHEAGMISTDPDIYNFLYESVRNMIDKQSVLWKKNEQLPKKYDNE